jgi:hypothetical protein
VGIISALLTIFITPHLQHYFWTHQRHAERQLAVLNQLNTLMSEVHFLMNTPKAVWPSNFIARRERLIRGLATAMVNVNSLFSEAASKKMQQLVKAAGEVLTWMEDSEPDPQNPDPKQVHFIETHRTTVAALYRDLGFPPSSLKAIFQRWYESILPASVKARRRA